MLTSALEYARRGWPVFPLVPRGKVPLTPNGFKDASVDPSVIQAWWERWPDANIGLATGSASGLLVLDVDAKHGGLDSMRALCGTRSFNTLTAHTGGGGLHVYFRRPLGDDWRNKAGFRPGLDIRADGGYVVAPPSIHESGKPYAWVSEIPVIDAPQWFLDTLQERPAPKPSSGADSDVVEGGRNDYLTRLGGTVQRRGASPQALAVLLHAENEYKCSPPLPDHEVDRIVQNLLRYEPEARLSAEVASTHEATKEGSLSSPLVTVASLMDETVAFLSDKDLVKGEPTGIAGLDEMLGGGKRVGEITVWHAQAKVGKSSLLHAQMYAWIKRGIPQAYASREMTPSSEVVPDLLSIHFNENARLAEMDVERVRAYRQAVTEWQLFLADGYGYFPENELEKWIDACQTAGVKYFYFDHLHWMLSDPSDYKEAIRVMQRLKMLAKKRQIHIDLIVQPNQLQPGERLSLNSMKGGAMIGQTLDNLFILERVVDEGTPPNISRLTLEVGRSKLCQRKSIYLRYDSQTTAFTEVDPVMNSAPSPPKSSLHQSNIAKGHVPMPLLNGEVRERKGGLGHVVPFE